MDVGYLARHPDGAGTIHGCFREIPLIPFQCLFGDDFGARLETFLHTLTQEFPEISHGSFDGCFPNPTTARVLFTLETKSTVDRESVARRLAQWLAEHGRSVGIMSADVKAEYAEIKVKAEISLKGQ
jgi:hypothetical protein